MHSAKVTFNTDYKRGQYGDTTRASKWERDTDELGHRGAGLCRDQGDEAEGEGIIETEDEAASTAAVVVIESLAYLLPERHTTHRSY